MKTLPMSIFFTLILAGYLWTDVALGHENGSDDLLPEFCVATFLATGNAAEAQMWLNRYSLRREYIAYMQLNLETLLKDGELRGEDIIAASDGCKEARAEEEAPE